MLAASLSKLSPTNAVVLEEVVYQLVIAHSDATKRVHSDHLRIATHLYRANSERNKLFSILQTQAFIVLLGNPFEGDQSDLQLFVDFVVEEALRNLSVVAKKRDFNLTLAGLVLQMLLTNHPALLSQDHLAKIKASARDLIYLELPVEGSLAAGVCLMTCYCLATGTSFPQDVLETVLMFPVDFLLTPRDVAFFTVLAAMSSMQLGCYVSLLPYIWESSHSEDVQFEAQVFKSIVAFSNASMSEDLTVDVEHKRGKAKNSRFNKVEYAQVVGYLDSYSKQPDQYEFLRGKAKQMALDSSDPLIRLSLSLFKVEFNGNPEVRKMLKVLRQSVQPQSA